MNVPAHVFRAYDVRGIVDQDLTPDFARELGRAIGTVARRQVGRLGQAHESGSTRCAAAGVDAYGGG